MIETPLLTSINTLKELGTEIIDPENLLQKLLSDIKIRSMDIVLLHDLPLSLIGWDTPASIAKSLHPAMTNKLLYRWYTFFAMTI
tara:strand:- start:232 stop:486 length:255 start_codon:yes stop_codon:yes gene_type:complete